MTVFRPLRQHTCCNMLSLWVSPKTRTCVVLSRNWSSVAASDHRRQLRHSFAFKISNCCMNNASADAEVGCNRRLNWWIKLNQVLLIWFYNAVTPAPKNIFKELNFLFVQGLTQGTLLRGCSYLTSAFGALYGTKQCGDRELCHDVLWINKCQGLWYHCVYSSSESQRACETFNHPMLESEFEGGPIKCQ